MASKISSYLAGGFKPYTDKNGKVWPDWRDYVKSELEDLYDFVDPRLDSDQSCIAHFTHYDLKHTESCDITFVYDSGQNSSGRVAEAATSLANKKMVVLIVATTTSEPLLCGMAKRIYVGLGAGVKYLKALAEAGLENEVKVAYQMIRERETIE